MILSSILCVPVAAASLLGSPFGVGETPYPQTVTDDRNLLKYVANAGPYSDRRGYGLNRDPPRGCSVDQVVMLGRHGERWPSKSAWKRIDAALKKITKKKGKLEGSLEFVNHWESFASKHDGWLQQESLTGPYAGLLDAYYHGVQYRRRYGHLFDGQSHLPLFVSAYQRDLDTGRKFGEGFLQWNYTDLAAVNLVLEENGANTLAPSCKLKNSTKSTNTLCRELKIFDEFNVAAARFNKENSALKLGLNGSDIIQLMNLVGYELNVRGSSPWANLFTSEEWVAYEYYSTSAVYCNRGPGSIEAPIEGSLFLNASRNLLLDGPEKSELPLAFTFSHDTNIIQLVSAMGIDAPKNRSDWETSEVSFGQRFDLTELVPQGARFVLERLSCSNDTTEPEYINAYPQAFTPLSLNASGQHPPQDRKYVRVVINEAVVPLDGCSNGPGKSCPLKAYDAWVNKKLEGLNFAEQCEIKPGQPKELTFFSNISLTNEFNTQSYEPYQATDLDSNGRPVS